MHLYLCAFRLQSNTLFECHAGGCRRDCKVTNLMPYGVFVTVAPGISGLVHVSELDIGFSDVTDWAVGDTMDVKCLEVCFSFLC